MPKVTVIPPSINRATRQSTTIPTRRKVAAYARVSTDFEEQLTSYEAQISYYTNYIQRNPDWEFVKIYTDEGISATSTKHREGFNSMIADALDGKIDLIITKSVSRFARNTVDSLTTIRKLKEHHVELSHILEVTTMDLLIQFAEIGLGIACVIRDFVKKELEEGTLVEVPVGFSFPLREIGFVCRQKDADSALIAPFFDDETEHPDK